MANFGLNVFYIYVSQAVNPAVQIFLEKVDMRLNEFEKNSASEDNESTAHNQKRDKQM